MIAHVSKLIVCLTAACLLSACGGPLGMLAGGKLDGDVVAFSDDAIPAQGGVIQLETRPQDPYSVNIGTVVIAGSLYMDPAAERRWYQHIQADPNIRIRFDGEETVYTALASAETDPNVLSQFEPDRVVLRIGPRD